MSTYPELELKDGATTHDTRTVDTAGRNAQSSPGDEGGRPLVILGVPRSLMRITQFHQPPSHALSSWEILNPG